MTAVDGTRTNRERRLCGQERTGFLSRGRQTELWHAVGVTILSVLVTVLPCACTKLERLSPSSVPPPLGAPEVRRITPDGQTWSHVSGVSWSPNGTKLALAWTFGGPDLAPEGYIYIVDVEGHKPRVLTQTRADGEIDSPAWSPISNQIAFYSSGWDPAGIWLVNASDKEAPKFLGEGKDCAWAPNGEEIAIADSTGTEYTICILNTRTGERRQVFQLSVEGKSMWGSGISWSPTGDRLAFSIDLDDYDSSTSPEMDIHVLDLVTGESRRLTESGYNWFPSWSSDGTMLAFSGEEWSMRTLVIMRVDDGSRVRPLGLHGVGPVAWSPDGNTIAFQLRGNVYAIDAVAAAGE